MNDSLEPLLLDHEIDGIRELDNKLPRWWVWLFYGSILFAIGYLAFYHVFRAGDLMAAEYEKEMKKGQEIKQRALSQFEASIDTLQPSNDPEVLARGRQIFATMCSPCHGPQGQGLVGPNLTDDYWIHGPLFKDNLHVILNGVPAKGMVTWKGILKPREIYSVASFIYTLRGTHPPNPKPPENLQPAKAEPSPYE